MRIQRHANSSRPGSRRGSALVMSLIAVATVVVLSASFSQFASAVANRQAQAVHRKRAFYLAEAGLAEAFAGFSCGRSGNVARGARTEFFEPDPELAKLASSAAAAVGAEIAGVDLVEDRAGQMYVLEVNQSVEFSGFQRAAGDRIDVADRIVEHLLSRSPA